MSWGIASVIAYEYPGFLTQLLAYSLAGGVSASRWAGQKHFASDLVIGSALGGYVGRQVFLSDLLQRRRHSEIWHRSAGERGARKPRPFTKLEISDPLNIPLDSWVYPALDEGGYTSPVNGYCADCFLQ